MNLIPKRLRGAVRRVTYRALVAGFSGASTFITRIKNWVPSNRESNDLIFSDGEMLRARSRALVRENPWACGGLDTFVANAIGTGIKPISMHPDPIKRKQIDKDFEIWTDQSDANGTSDYYGQQKLVCRATLQDGECFTRLRFRRPEDNLHVPLQLQLLEADFVPYSKEENTPANYTRGGIKFDLLGRRLSYWMFRDHPGSGFVRDPTLYEIPASQVLHVYEVQRLGQLRGQPWLTPAIVMLYDIKQFLDATLLRAKIANLLSFWIKRGPTGQGMLNETDQGDATAVAGVTPGSVQYLNEGEEVIATTPPNMGVGLDEFLTAMLRAASRALRLTEQQFTGDMSGVNYSSARVALLEFRRTMEAFIHQVIVFQWCRPGWEAWMDQAALAGVIDAKDYAANRADYLAVNWEPQGWEWVDPEAEVAALKAACRSGFVSRRKIVARTGESLEQIDQENAEDNKRADSLDLAYDSDGRKADKGAEQTTAAQPKPGAPPPAPAKTNGKGAPVQ